ncbi:MAG: flavin reductase family protein [Candidatus Peribacteraceae bacterium]|nr:flavin reductase family protein [Candidatus Peribacteraceae bacterium]
MDLPYGTPASMTFVTNLGLITTDGPLGANVSTIEWTHLVSYTPGLIAVCVDPPDANHENIEAIKEFGVSLAAADQNVLASLAGNTKGRKIDKIGFLRELGFSFVPSTQIKPPLVEGAIAQYECKLLQQIKPGNRTVFIGEVLVANVFPDKEPLAYHQRKFWKLGEQVHKPGKEELEKQAEVMEKYKRS